MRPLTLPRVLAALTLLGGALLVFSAPATASPSAPHPTESPSGSCYKYSYPNVEGCGTLKGTEECKGSPTKDTEACKPTKGDSCVCGDDDIF